MEDMEDMEDMENMEDMEVQIVEGLRTVLMVSIPKHVPKGCQHSRCVGATMQS